MSTRKLSDDVRDGPSLICDWCHQGLDAASVQASGRLDAATSPELVRVLAAALRDARLVLLNMRSVIFADASGVQVIADASVRARAAGRRVLVVALPPQVSEAFNGALGEIEWLQTESAPVGERLRHERLAPDAAARRDAERGIRPLDNPVNVRVLPARVMAVPDAGLWLHDTDGRLHRAWTPKTEPVAHGTPLEIYIDAHGAINGWRNPDSGLAINQRRFDRVESPAIGSDLRCRGACGVVWRAPAAAHLIEHHERCLTCAGALALD